MILAIILLIGCNDNKIREYYDNGQLKAIASLKNGMLEGKTYYYYETGNLSGECFFKNGLRQGVGIYYYPNGIIEQKVFYKNDTIVKSATFRTDGTLEIIKLYNDEGKLIEYTYYLDSSQIDPDPYKKYPIFITQTDTVKKGDIYSGEIRLGHRFWDNVYIMLGDTTSYILKSRPFLKRTSSYVSIFEIDTDTCILGKNVITGFVLEKADTCDGCGWLAPFKHEFYVLSGD